MLKRVKKLIIITGLLLALLVVANQALAVDFCINTVNNAIGLSSASDIRVIIARIINIALGFLGIIAVILIIYAGWLWMTAGGEADKIDRAKRILTGAIIGLIIISAILGDLVFSAYKRIYETKDFMTLIKGHGGIIDIYDSLLISSITFYFLIQLTGSSNSSHSIIFP